MRVAYLGTSEFAVGPLRRLAASRWRPALVVTPPDRPKGRGRRPAPPPVAIAARELGLELHQSESVSAAPSAELLLARADLGIVCAFGQLIREPLLSGIELLNVHPSLVPRWRGAAPIERAIMAGDTETGVTIMRVTAELDAGPVALQERVPIEPGDDYGSLAPRLAELGGELALRALELRESGALELSEQDGSQATYAAKIEPGERRLDPARPALELERVVRALTPHIGAYLELAGGERLGVRRARALEADVAAGSVVARDGTLLVGCAEGALGLEEVQPPGRRAMPADAYLRGHPVPVLA